ncbi:predicted protein [Naegleria gruberi]|uniref:Predicted protein n=1 Tax=Naegleria gruberi TaxID=5762 RepID=D2W6B8_NAEGR|nr:uncharacterized protein NAEGRDRAFT_76961 [Naegleria gruberi]EFC35385.1 predicted protein [Naegleria gruberi]|eukprot:XP_002668129.1 predicted protein [Naegleria gruberi strain NEG-M]
MSQLDHDGIVKVFKFETITDKFKKYSLILMEKMDKDLSEHIFTDFGGLKFGKISQILFVLLDVSSSLAYCHQKRIIHYDVKPVNILLTTRKIGNVDVIDKVKIADFGISVEMISTIASSAEHVGTRVYMPPEMLKKVKDIKYNYRAFDAYSFGITMFELLSGDKLDNDRVDNFLTIEQLSTKYPGLSYEIVERLNKLGSSCILEDHLNRCCDFEYIHDELLDITMTIFRPYLKSTVLKLFE